MLNSRSNLKFFNRRYIILLFGNPIISSRFSNRIPRNYNSFFVIFNESSSAGRFSRS
nr:MAG TPA: hypothetical protein [Caudoviricetes sp.]